jgi:phosphoribosylformylglycinamidine cyclo-ligase
MHLFEDIGGTISPQATGPVSLFRLNTDKYRSPILTSATDGVGTKLTLARQLGVYDTVGLDAVALVADDVVASGATPLFLLAQMHIGEMHQYDVDAVLAGVANGCAQVGCEFIRHAVRPAPTSGVGFDLLAAGVGVVDADDLLGRHRVQVGDAMVAITSSGLHANGFGIVRSKVLGYGRTRLDSVVDDVDGEHTLGEVLLTPSRIYAPAMLKLISECHVNALAHVTGGGIPGNITRVLPEFADAVVDRATWSPPPVFGYIAENGRISPEEMERSFNMGIGMIVILSRDAADRAVSILSGLGQQAWVVGEVVAGDGRINMVGQYGSDN